MSIGKGIKGIITAHEDRRYRAMIDKDILSISAVIKAANLKFEQ